MSHFGELWGTFLEAIPALRRCQYPFFLGGKEHRMVHTEVTHLNSVATEGDLLCRYNILRSLGG